MKIQVISSVYKSKQVNFGGYLINFDAKGLASLEIEEEKVENFKEILVKYKGLIFEGNKIPESQDIKQKEVVESTEKKAESNADMTKAFEMLKSSNVTLAKENESLKKENESLKKENEALVKENEFLKKENESLKKENEEEKEEKKEIVEQDATSQEDKENDEVTQELNAKTVNELKGILNDIYGDFKEEWKNLVKKDDIVKYIISKLNSK